MNYTVGNLYVLVDGGVLECTGLLEAPHIGSVLQRIATATLTPMVKTLYLDDDRRESHLTAGQKYFFSPSGKICFFGGAKEIEGLHNLRIVREIVP